MTFPPPASGSRRPVVSVVTAFLNEERFLAEAIESVLAQTDADWELLLVDDGSTDGSTGIACNYAGRMPDRIRYFEHPGHENRGTAPARNLGLRHARGEFVAFLDADDVYLPGNLARQVGVLRRHPEVGMVMGRTLHWHSWAGGPADRLRKLGPLKPGLVRPPALVPLFLAGRVETPGTCSVLIRRSVLDEEGGFDESLRVLFEDAALFYRIALSFPVYVEGACSARYRQHAASVCHEATREQRYHPWMPNPAHQALLVWLGSHLAAQSTVDAKVARALNRALWPYEHPQVAAPLKGGEYVLRRIAGYLRGVARRTLPFGRRTHAPGLSLDLRPAVGRVRFGSLRRLTPISRDFGYDRGSPVDRRYIERFLAENADAIRGRVLEVGDNAYTRRFGGDRVAQSDVLHVNPGASGATIIGDLSRAGDLPDAAFDCIVLTQTLHLLYDAESALRNARRSLKPGGILLATFPGISQLSFDEWGDRWYWSFTPHSAARLFGDVFGGRNASVLCHGNVLAAVAHLHGIAAEELRPEELDADDPHYPVIITVRATRGETGDIPPGRKTEG